MSVDGVGDFQVDLPNEVPLQNQETEGSGRSAWDPVDTMRRNLVNMTEPYLDKAESLVQGSLVLEEWLEQDGNAGKTIDDFFNDPNVTSEGKDVVMKAMLTEANPDASPEEIDQMLADVKERSGGELNASSLDHARAVTTENGGDADSISGDEKVKTAITTFDKTASDYTDQATSEEVILFAKRIEAFMTAIADMFISVMNKGSQMFSKPQ